MKVECSSVALVQPVDSPLSLGRSGAALVVAVAIVLMSGCRGTNRALLIDGCAAAAAESSLSARTECDLGRVAWVIAAPSGVGRADLEAGGLPTELAVAAERSVISNDRWCVGWPSDSEHTAHARSRGYSIECVPSSIRFLSPLVGHGRMISLEIGATSHERRTLIALTASN